MLEPAISSWEVELQCPQCGAPISLGEADRLLSCSYCRVRLYLWTPEHFCYYMPAPKACSEELIFIPYWRFKGALFSVVRFGIQHRVVDATLCAYLHRILPMTPGIRPQALKLHFVSNEVGGTFVKPQLPLNEAVTRIQKQSEEIEGAPLNNSPFHREFIGDLGSLVFSPVFIRKGKLFDAILAKPIGLIREQVFGDAPSGLPDHWQITPLPALCPNCGNGLRGGRESLLLLCKVCHAAYVPSSSGWKASKFEVVSSNRDPFTYLPFWRMVVSVKGLRLQSYADLARLANLPRLIQPGWETQEVLFWIPAFKVPPTLFLRLSRQLTLFQPREKTDVSLPEAPLPPVTVSEKNAAACLKIVLSSLLTKKKDYFPRLSEIEINPAESALVFIPFTLSGTDLVHPQMGISVQRQILSRDVVDMGSHLIPGGFKG